jgi:hypothetical protein
MDKVLVSHCVSGDLDSKVAEEQHHALRHHVTGQVTPNQLQCLKHSSLYHISILSIRLVNSLRFHWAIGTKEYRSMKRSTRASIIGRMKKGK